ncbi:MAG: methyltransferase [Candidatus Aenigmarchaeota archaeon]|nr:methyltransferase [Candidatus Aenigmarchaeota archaeon]
MKNSPFFYDDISLEIPEDVYEPREDSLLAAKHLEMKTLSGKKCLDMGCGSGLLAVLMAKKGGAVTAADINGEAVEITRKNAESNEVKLKAVVSDVFSAIDDKYDFIAFNPPYLPDGAGIKGKEQWSGGAGGRDMIGKFLSGLKNHLNENGKVMMVFSSLTGEKEVRELSESNGFSFRVIDREKVPWEELILAEINHED